MPRIVASAALVALAACEGSSPRSAPPEATAQGTLAPVARPAAPVVASDAPRAPAPVADDVPGDAIAASPSASPADGSARHPAVPRATPAGRAAGDACSSASGPRGDCAPGLACCTTGFRGHCGGAYLPDRQEPACVFTSTCAPPPCRPLLLPP